MGMTTIRFQATGEKHKVAGIYQDEENFWWITECGQKCLPMAPIGKLPVEPEKTDCEDCYDTGS